MKKDKDEKSVKQNPYFRKDDEGRDIYYPWGYPGESYYVSKSIKSKIKSVGGALLFLFGLCVFIPLSDQFGDISVSLWATPCSLAVFPTLYFMYVGYVRKSLRVTPKEQVKEGGPRVVWDCLTLASLNLFLGLLNIGLFNTSFSLKVFIILVTLMYLGLALFAWYKKGYIFQEEPS